MTTKKHLSTRAMASLISEFAPNELVELNAIFPNQSDLFDTAYTLGESSSITNLDDTNILAIREMVNKTLTLSEPLLTKIEKTLTMRSRFSRKLRLIGSLVTTVSSASIFGSIIAAHPEIVPWLSILGLLSSICIIIGEHFEKSLLSNQKSLGELFSEAMLADAKLREIKLRFISENLADINVVVDIAQKANELAATVKFICVFGGVKLTI